MRRTHPAAGFEIVNRKRVVRILGEIGRVIEHDEPQNHLLERNLVHGDSVLGKMRRRIDMGAVLADHFVISGAESVLADSVGFVSFGIGRSRELGLAEAGPDRCFG